MTRIYGLRDPRHPGRVAYVGSTKGTLADRLTQHLVDREPSKRVRWLGELRALGLRPSIELLEEVAHSERNEAEFAWIEWVKLFGSVKNTRFSPYVENHLPSPPLSPSFLAELSCCSAELAQLRLSWPAKSSARRQKPPDSKRLALLLAASGALEGAASAFSA